MAENKKERKKQFQVWEDYIEGWHLTEFDTFTECVDYINSSGAGYKARITKLVDSEVYISGDNV